MSSPETTLRQFGEDAGFPGLAFDVSGQVVLETESGRQVGVELAGQETLIYIALPLAYDAGTWLLRAWKRAHHAHQGDWPVQAALREAPGGGSRLLVLTRLSATELTTPRLRHALEYLSRWLDTVRDDA